MGMEEYTGPMWLCASLRDEHVDLLTLRGAVLQRSHLSGRLSSPRIMAPRTFAHALLCISARWSLTHDAQITLYSVCIAFAAK